MTDRFESAIARFDAANSEDPESEHVEGVARPRALVYAQRMTAWLHKMEPQAAEPLRLATRCQHIRRWQIPRERYPMDRQGYHQWRDALAEFHARTAGEILTEVGYDAETITRVQDLVQKKNLRSDPDSQLLEDVICLVFLESYFSDFARKHEPEKLTRIIRKTWKKMSPRGHELALTLNLSDADRALIEKALDD